MRRYSHPTTDKDKDKDMSHKTVYRTVYNAHGQVESYNAPLKLYPVETTGSGIISKIVQSIVLLGGLVIVGMIIWTIYWGMGIVH